MPRSSVTCDYFKLPTTSPRLLSRAPDVAPCPVQSPCRSCGGRSKNKMDHFVRGESEFPIGKKAWWQLSKRHSKWSSAIGSGNGWGGPGRRLGWGRQAGCGSGSGSGLTGRLTSPQASNRSLSYHSQKETRSGVRGATPETITSSPRNRLRSTPSQRHSTRRRRWRGTRTPLPGLDPYQLTGARDVRPPAVRPHEALTRIMGQVLEEAVGGIDEQEKTTATWNASRPTR
jgi:hypothetical protein